MKKILLIENNQDFAYVLQWHFEQKGWQVFTATTGKLGIEFYQNQLPDLVLLDINLDEEMDGKEVARYIRTNDTHTPIIFMSGESKSPKDVVEGFEIGCNFFLKKPVSIEEIEVHIQALINTHQPKNIYKFSQSVLNTDERTLLHEGKKQWLSEKESKVLAYLAQHLTQTVDLYDILEEVWGDTSMEESLRNIISSLRKKITHTGLTITTIKNKGYLLEG